MNGKFLLKEQTLYNGTLAVAVTSQLCETAWQEARTLSTMSSIVAPSEACTVSSQVCCGVT